MANTHAHTIRTSRTYRTTRPTFTIAEIVTGLVHESARRMMASQIDDDADLETRIHDFQKAWILDAAAELVSKLEVDSKPEVGG